MSTRCGGTSRGVAEKEALAATSKVSDAGSEVGFETIENCEVDPDSEPDSKETESVPCASACRWAK